MTDRPLRRRMIAVAALAAAALCQAAPARAQDAGRFVDGVAQQVLGMVKAGQADSAGLARVLRASFDLPYMARSAAGPNWNRATPEQQARYVAAVECSEVGAYSDRFRQYGGQTFQIVRTAPGAAGAQNVESQILQPNGPPVRVQWEVQNRNGLKVTDVVVEGVSMVVTRRSDFTAFLSRNGGNLDELTAALQKRCR